MDDKAVLILTRQKPPAAQEWKNVTSTIKSIECLGNQYEVTFNQGKKYIYNKNNVQYFDQPEPINIEQSIVIVKGLCDQRWQSAIVFGPYICLFRNQVSFYTRLEQVEIIPNIAENPATRNLIEYYQYLADFLKETTPHLSYYYENRLTSIRKDTVLENFINETPPYNNEQIATPIFPFGINPSQRQAVINALGFQISLIQGPPGTGKTQTILNIIANLLLQNKTVAVVAGNNSATANVYEKLEKENIGFLAAKLGKNEFQKEFFEQEHIIPELISWQLSHEEHSKLSTSVNLLGEQITRLLDVKNQLALLKETISRLTIEKQYFEKHFAVNPANPEKWSFANKWETPALLNFLAELEHYSQHEKLTWTVKLRWLYKYHIYRFRDLNSLSDTIFKQLVGEYYNRKLAELVREREGLELDLTSHNFDGLLKRHTQESLCLLKSHLALRYQGMENSKFDPKSYKSKFLSFQERFPVVLSTTDSIINNKAEDELFDYLIVDEASQVDLLTGFLAMSCAKNIVAVGDLKQLPHIPSRLLAKEYVAADDRFNIQPGYSYQHQSLLSSLNTLFEHTAPVTLLKEHYRCHPRIIDFCNQKFYGGQLVIMTEAFDDPFKVLKTLPGNHARKPPSGKGLLNIRELDVINNEVLNGELKQIPYDKIGFVTPYRGQTDKAKSYIVREGVQIDTVYKYQGREKDIIIFSTAANAPDRFVDNPNLLNVAVSRAKERFIMVTSQNSFKQQGSNIGDLIRHIEYQSQSQSIFESKTVSIFDCLYKEYADVLKVFRAKVKDRSKYLSENLMATLLDEILENESYNSFAYHFNYSLHLLVNDFTQLTYREKEFASHPHSHVDFLLYNK